MMKRRIQRHPSKIARETMWQRQVFSIWYKNDCNFEQTRRVMLASVNELGRDAPLVQTMKNWSSYYSWPQRARQMDMQAESQRARTDIHDKVNFLHLQRRLGRVMLNKSLEHFEADHFSFDKTSDAISAAKAGVDMERQAIGIPNWSVDLAQLEDEEIHAQYLQLEREMLAGKTVEGDYHAIEGDHRPGTPDAGFAGGDEAEGSSYGRLPESFAVEEELGEDGPFSEAIRDPELADDRAIDGTPE